MIAALDELKKFNPGARDSIKFLEDEIKHGNRYIYLLTTSNTSVQIISHRHLQGQNEGQKQRGFSNFASIKYLIINIYFIFGISARCFG